MSYDFQLEMKLAAEAPALHKVFCDNVLCVQNMLNKYQSIFPNYTDHTALHSLEVISFCNELVGDNIAHMNTDEIFILLMAAYLHDTGMGISLQDYEQFLTEMPMVEEYVKQHPEVPTDDIIRSFHHEFSGRHIRKYSGLFDFPTPEHLFGVIQVSRGHRKTDLFDESEYPRALKLPNGNVLHLSYLATLIRLADELDIAADRNIQFLFDTTRITNKASAMEFRKHKAIRKLAFAEDAMTFYVDASDPDLLEALDILFQKLKETLAYCVSVAENCSPVTIHQKTIKIIRL